MFRSSLGNRSQRQKRDDETFMNALKDIKTLQASKGRLSMDASDLQEQVEQMKPASAWFLAANQESHNGHI